jgi:hypothetical protein
MSSIAREDRTPSVGETTSSRFPRTSERDRAEFAPSRLALQRGGALTGEMAYRPIPDTDQLREKLKILSEINNKRRE